MGLATETVRTTHHCQRYSCWRFAKIEQIHAFTCYVQPTANGQRVGFCGFLPQIDARLLGVSPQRRGVLEHRLLALFHIVLTTF
ncbi:hypothetical protein RSSM_06373 [Rhodopirellula sallentina SM41]|uniref:Uncharacterized protein n=1 Tax=Rhodopirellula sallentina SM41 TaxID=1263870 RepID=M5TSK8_9BACT|nr:hypothetical protein RSSM_06373 [Rhodopirellula sallentina SM41]